MGEVLEPVFGVPADNIIFGGSMWRASRQYVYCSFGNWGNGDPRGFQEFYKELNFCVGWNLSQYYVSMQCKLINEMYTRMGGERLFCSICNRLPVQNKDSATD